MQVKFGDAIEPSYARFSYSECIVRTLKPGQSSKRQVIMTTVHAHNHAMQDAGREDTKSLRTTRILRVIRALRDSAS